MEARQSVELEDWQAVTRFGSGAVKPLVTFLKMRQAEPDTIARAERSLAGIDDPDAFPLLAGMISDEDICAAAGSSLLRILESHAGDVATEHLQTIARLPSVSQVRYQFDPVSGTYSRAASEEIDLLQLASLVAAELRRRGVDPEKRHSEGASRN